MWVYLTLLSKAENVKRYLKNFVGFGFFRSNAFFSVKNQSKVMMLIGLGSKF
jgi:hypothetical protein